MWMIQSKPIGPGLAAVAAAGGNADWQDCFVPPLTFEEANKELLWLSSEITHFEYQAVFRETFV